MQGYADNRHCTYQKAKRARKKKINELIEQAEIQLYGEGVPVDLSKAAVLYGQAADLGSPKAMMRLSALLFLRLLLLV